MMLGGATVKKRMFVEEFRAPTGRRVFSVRFSDLSAHLDAFDSREAIFRRKDIKEKWRFAVQPDFSLIAKKESAFWQPSECRASGQDGGAQA